MHYMLAATSFTGLTVQQGLENAEQQAAETIPATALPMPDTICPEVERLVAGCYRPEYAIRLGFGLIPIPVVEPRSRHCMLAA